MIDMMCNTFRNAMHIVAERTQRNVCQNYWTMAPKLLIVPYVPATSDIARPLKVRTHTFSCAMSFRLAWISMAGLLHCRICITALPLFPAERGGGVCSVYCLNCAVRHPPSLQLVALYQISQASRSCVSGVAQGFQMKVTPANERHIMLWFRTKCLPYIMEGQGRYVNGHRFCHHVAIALGKAGLDVDVSCTDRQLGGRPLPFRRCCAFPPRVFHLLPSENLASTTQMCISVS